MVLLELVLDDGKAKWNVTIGEISMHTITYPILTDYIYIKQL